MAEKLTEWPRGVRPGCHGSKYEQFLDGGIWKITLKEIGLTKAASLVAALNHAGRVRGLRVSTRTVDDGAAIVMQAVKR